MAELHSNRDEHDRRFDKALEKALRLVGGFAERKAKETISDMGAVDTGFLRNSITWALDGEEPNAKEYTDDSGTKLGEYNGETDPERGGSRAVYVGTNVYYAPYVQYGTCKMPERPFLSQSILDNRHEAENLFREAFENFM